MGKLPRRERAAHAFQPAITRLDDRVLLTGITAFLDNGLLRVQGSDLGDRIEVQVTGTQLRVIGSNDLGTYYDQFQKAGTWGIVVNARGGNDVVRINDGFTTRPLVTTLRGGDGDDTIQGGAATDVIEGGLGNDSLFGRLGNDRIYGQEGADYLDPGTNGNDELYGGLGRDRIKLTLSGRGTRAWGGLPELDTFIVGFGSDRAINIRKIQDLQPGESLPAF